MLELVIPGRGVLALRYLLLDLNGTLALDGRLLEGMDAALARVAAAFDVRLLSADTHGTATAIAAQLGLPLTRLDPGDEAEQKGRVVELLGAATVAAIGNGANDIEMLRRAALGIAVLGREGAAAACLTAADVVAPDILVALELLSHPRRLLATLRF
jgi:P-type E1-E2 ATPase